MFTIPFITSQLFPKKTLEEQNALAQDCLDYGIDYDTPNWLKVEESDIIFGEVKRNLIRTLHEMQYGYDGISFVIMDSLEAWSSGTLEFKNMTPEDQDFCQRYYMMIGFLCFANIGRRRQCYLIGSHFFVLACIWKIPVYLNIRYYFSTLTYVWEMKEDAELFATVIKNNPVGLVGDRGFKRSVANWISIFDEYLTKNPSDTVKKVDEFMSSSMEVQRLDADQKSVLSKALSLYDSLVTGAMWMDIDFDETLGNEHKPKVPGRPINEYYLDALEKIDKEKFVDWLSSYKEVAQFIDSTKLGDEFIERMFKIIKEKVDFKNEQQTTYLMDFINLLKQGGWSEIDKVVYFDEKLGDFVWDSESFV